ncbi:hypothetical protein [Bosea sp. WAO]|nr:hypothetical protein [Bosea sp. WAO]
MAIALFSVAMAAFGSLALGTAEAGVALGLFSFLGLWIGRRAFTDA